MLKHIIGSNYFIKFDYVIYENASNSILIDLFQRKMSLQAATKPVDVKDDIRIEMVEEKDTPEILNLLKTYFFKVSNSSGICFSFALVKHRNRNFLFAMTKTNNRSWKLLLLPIFNYSYVTERSVFFLFSLQSFKWCGSFCYYYTLFLSHKVFSRTKKLLFYFYGITQSMSKLKKKCSFACLAEWNWSANNIITIIIIVSWIINYFIYQLQCHFLLFHI